MGWVFQFAMSVTCVTIFLFFQVPKSQEFSTFKSNLLNFKTSPDPSSPGLNIKYPTWPSLHPWRRALLGCSSAPLNPRDFQWTPCAGVLCLQVTNQTYLDIMKWVNIVRNVTIPLYQTYTSYKQPSLKSYGCKKYFSSKLTLRVKIRSQNLNLSSALVWRESPGAEANEAAPNFSW